jgi:hypothetical protein
MDEKKKTFGFVKPEMLKVSKKDKSFCNEPPQDKREPAVRRGIFNVAVV